MQSNIRVAAHTPYEAQVNTAVSPYTQYELTLDAIQQNLKDKLLNLLTVCEQEIKLCDKYAAETERSSPTS